MMVNKEIKNDTLKDQNDIEERLEEIDIKIDDSRFKEKPDEVELFSIEELINYE